MKGDKGEMGRDVNTYSHETSLISVKIPPPPTLFTDTHLDICRVLQVCQVQSALMVSQVYQVREEKR